MSNITILPPGSGSHDLRTLLRHVVALPAERDPILRTPPNEGFSLGTTRGRVRERNEDRVVVLRAPGGNGDRPWMLFALCDGMGGMADGAHAAELAISSLISSSLTSRLGGTEENLRRSVAAANDAVFAQFQGRGGATLSAIVWDSSRLITANVGDSRIWALGVKSALEQLTQDDNIAGQLKAQGVEGADDARRDLLQFIGVGADMTPHVEVRKAEGLQFVIATSDGAHGVPEVVDRIARHATHSGEIVDRLVQLSLWCGGVDNATVVCFQPQPVPRGAVGYVELWVPSGYFRVVRDDTPRPSVHRASSVSSSANDEEAKDKRADTQKKQARKPKATTPGKSKRGRENHSKDAAGDVTEPGHVEISIGEAESAEQE